MSRYVARASFRSVGRGPPAARGAVRALGEGRRWRCRRGRLRVRACGVPRHQGHQARLQEVNACGGTIDTRGSRGTWLSQVSTPCVWMAAPMRVKLTRLNHDGYVFCSQALDTYIVPDSLIFNDNLYASVPFHTIRESWVGILSSRHWVFRIYVRNLFWTLPWSLRWRNSSWGNLHTSAKLFKVLCEIPNLRWARMGTIAQALWFTVRRGVCRAAFYLLSSFNI